MEQEKLISKDTMAKARKEAELQKEVEHLEHLVRG